MQAELHIKMMQEHVIRFDNFESGLMINLKIADKQMEGLKQTFHKVIYNS